MLLTAVHKGRAELIDQDRHQMLMTAYTAYPECFVSQPPPSLRLPCATWGSRLFRRRVDSDGTGTTIASGAHLQGIHNGEGIGMGPEPVVVSPSAIPAPTDEGLH